MIGIVYLLVFLAGGAWIARCLLPERTLLFRAYFGAVIGTVLMMWLPALWACAFSFGAAAHALAAAALAALCGLCFALRSRAPLRAPDGSDARILRRMAYTVLPLLLLSLYLEYTHTLAKHADGSLWVGQSTYGDLQLHLAIASGSVNAKFPLMNTLLAGETLAYPPLCDTFAGSLILMGLPLTAAMLVSSGLFLLLVYTGALLLYERLCRRKGAAALAFFLLFLNGGLGFLYVLDSAGGTTVLENLRDVMTGYYHTPTNQPTPYNLRWVNLICDMLVPQRTFLGGWAVLLGALNLLAPAAADRERPGIREAVLVGVLGGALPLIHTHSYLALVLASAGMFAYAMLRAPKAKRKETLVPWLLYAGVAAALSVPQLFGFTFRQTGSSDHFLKFQFNWCNNRGGNGLVDPYFWFYLKNIGVPYVLIVCAALRRKPKDIPELPDDLYHDRLLLCGAFAIYAVAELVRFQPNEYDNNKLFYVWFMLCLPAAADWALDAFRRLKGAGGRAVVAALFLVLCFTSSGLTVARECVSGYQAYRAEEAAAADFIRENTPEGSVFLTGTQHLNPVSALAGRTVVCGPDLYLYFHGYSTAERKEELEAFYAFPEDNAETLAKYGVSYLWVSDWERASYDVDEAMLDSLYGKIYSAGGIAVYRVGEEAAP